MLCKLLSFLKTKKNVSTQNFLLCTRSSNCVNNISKCNFTTTNHVNSENRVTRKPPGVVRIGFLPDEWFTAFFPKTGVSGFGTFLFTLSTFLISKEFYVMEHEYYNGLSLAIMYVVAAKEIGPMVAAWADKEIDDYEHSWNKLRTDDKDNLETHIKHEETEQWRQDGQLILVQAKRENVLLQLEAAYRQRLMDAYWETRNRLDYCVTRDEVEKAIAQRYMTNWIIASVKKSVTKEIQDQALKKCFEDLSNLSKAYDKLGSPYPSGSSDDSSKK